MEKVQCRYRFSQSLHRYRVVLFILPDQFATSTHLWDRCFCDGKTSSRMLRGGVRFRQKEFQTACEAACEEAVEAQGADLYTCRMTRDASGPCPFGTTNTSHKAFLWPPTPHPSCLHFTLSSLHRFAEALEHRTSIDTLTRVNAGV